MIFDKQFFLRNQQLLRWFSNTSYGKDILGHDLDKVDLILPNAVYQKLDKNRYKAEFRTHDKYTKRLFYEYKPIWKAFHWFDERIANVYIPRLNLGFDSLTAYPAAGAAEPVDGIVARLSVDQTFAGIRTSAGNFSRDNQAAEDFAALRASTTSSQYQNNVRGVFLFDTSSIPDSADISTATLSLYGTAKDNGIGAAEVDIVSSNPASTSALVSADYAYTNFGTTVYASDTYAGWSTSAYNDQSLNASGIANISLTGISKFGGRLNWDTDASFGGSWSSGAISKFSAYTADQTGTANDPKLVVTYTLPGGFFYMST